MQALIKTSNQLNKIPNYTRKCGYTLLAKDFDLFDQNGYDLTKIEQFYCIANSFMFHDHRGFRQAIKQDWFTDVSTYEGAHLNHALLFERKGFDSDAYEELLRFCKINPRFYKVLNIRPKWGLDFSVDYCDNEGNVFEVFHWEYDGFDYNEIVEMKESHEEQFLKIDWNDAAKTLLKKKYEWYYLDFFDQSKYKSDFFGIQDERFKLVLWK